MRKEFKAKLQGMGPGGAWTCLKVPFSVEKGILNGFGYGSSIFPRGDGTHMMMVNKAMQQGARARAGGTVKVTMEADTAPRTVAVPSILKKALAKNQRAQAAFNRLSYSHKKEYVDSITEAKQPETRARRVKKTVAALVQKA